ncbi:MAG: PEGA domain-containing protein [Planctomycetota bacterium]
MRSGAWTALLGVVLLTGGCADRRLVITSAPPGALVWVNDVELGRTPLEASFVHYGTYDVRLRLEGYEPVVTSAVATAPWYEYVGPDLVAEAMPWGVETRVRWNFTLKPALESTMGRPELEKGLIDRARELGKQTAPIASEPSSSEPSSPD